MPDFSRLVDISKALKPTEQTGPSFHVSFVLKGRKVVSIGTNSYSKRNVICLKYKNTRGYDPKAYSPGVHSEMQASAKVKHREGKFTLVNVRINNRGEVDYSCPCPNCAFQLGKMDYISRIFYSTKDGFKRFP